MMSKLFQPSLFVFFPLLFLSQFEWNSLQIEQEKRKNPQQSASSQVQISEFSAIRLRKEVVLLKWVTEQEGEHKGFVIERSLDGTSFDSLSYVGGSSSASRPMHYHYMDLISEESAVQYRLKHTSKDEVVSYSESIVIQDAAQLNTISEISVRPQHFQDSVTVFFVNRKAGLFRFLLYSSAGELLHSQAVETNIGPDQLHFVDTLNLPKGTYIATLENAEGELKVMELVKKGKNNEP
ncbi:MAG: hypothetical protein AAF399_08155 [Bacteroidota bacterium]